MNDTDAIVYADLIELIQLLERYGHTLSMPYAKPISGGLWELRRTGRPQVRILYGFHKGEAVLVHALKKQDATLRQKDVELAHKRFTAPEF